MWIKTTNGAYPLTEGAIKAQHLNTSFPQPFQPGEPYEWVFPTPQPAYDPITLGVRELAPIEADGKYYQQWDVYPLEPETIAANQQAAALRVKDEIIQNTQKRLDDFAKTRLYDGILSACTYATSSVPKFQAEGQYCVDARDNTWATLYTVLAEVEAGTRPMPGGYADVESLLPNLVWPA
jgi:hypothetical protein